jgi:uncharacterized protein
MPRHALFDWDPAKAAENVRKHGVGFEESAASLADEWGEPFQVDEYQEHPNEDRWKTYVLHAQDRDVLLTVVWTEEPKGVTRIISARRTTRIEEQTYAHEIFK